MKTNPFNGEPNWSHAVCVPVIGLYYLFVHREDLLKAHATQFVWGRFLRPSRALASVIMIAVATAVYFLTKDRGGIAIAIIRDLGLFSGALGVLVLLLDWSMATMLFGLGMFVYGIYPGQNDYLKDLGMVATLFGIVLLLCGWNVMKIAYFPIVFLICALPWPGLVYSWVAEPLQQMAAHVAVDVLKTTGVDSVCSGTKIVIVNANPALPPRVLNVAEACAGMRSLMTFIAVAGAVAFLSPRPLWQKIIIVFSAVPIAIFCNVMRISGQGLLDHYVSPAWSESFAHQFVGMMMLLPAFFLILGVGYVLDKMFIEEADENDMPQYASPGAITAAPLRNFGTAAVAAAAKTAAMPSAIPVAPAAKVSAPSPVAAVPSKPLPPAQKPPTVPPRPAAPGPVAAAPLVRKPVASTPPRPVTAANLRPRAPLPGSAGASAARTAQPAIPPNRQTVRPPVNPPAAKPAVSKTPGPAQKDPQ